MLKFSSNDTRPKYFVVSVSKSDIESDSKVTKKEKAQEHESKNEREITIYRLQNSCFRA